MNHSNPPKSLDDILSPDYLEESRKLLEKARSKGISVDSIDDLERIIAFGYLTGIGVAEVISGGREIPYVIKLKK